MYTVYTVCYIVYVYTVPALQCTVCTVCMLYERGTYIYSMGHKKVPVPFTWNGISTVLCVAFPYRFRVYNFRTSNFDAFDVRT